MRCQQLAPVRSRAQLVLLLTNCRFPPHRSWNLSQLLAADAAAPHWSWNLSQLLAADAAASPLRYLRQIELSAPEMALEMAREQVGEMAGEMAGEMEMKGVPRAVAW